MARRNPFYFTWTCPKIDSAISTCKDRLESHLEDYIRELCPLLPDDVVFKLSKEWSKVVYEDISDCFESVRETNEEMREAANAQISDLEDTIESLKEEIKALED